MTPDYFMNAAWQEALKAFDDGEVPVGAVIEKNGKIIGRGYNRTEKLLDATAHAEILAIGAASSYLDTWRLNGCNIYITLEPCIMCLGAILQARIDSIIYATPDPHLGAIDSFYYRHELERAYKYFPHIKSGIMKEQCSKILKSFFKQQRRKK
jgi:tRNA(adenine34) deaminase